MLPGSEPIKVRDGDADDDILREARERARHALEIWSENFDAARADVIFLGGKQWPDEVVKERTLEGRPMLTLNKLPQFVDQVLGDQRQNRPSIQVVPVEGDADEKLQNVAGNADFTRSKIYEALIRNIEHTSKAEAHYDTAFQQAVEGGFGWLRVYPKYSTDDSFDQDLCIKAIRNRFAVLMGPFTEPDGSDAPYCFISEEMPRTEFRKRYPDAIVGDIADADRDGYGWWITQESVRVAEYFSREPVTRALVLLSNGHTAWKDVIEPVLDELAGEGVTVVRTRNVQTYKVVWRKLTAYSLLEGPVDVPISTIPVVPVTGKEIVLEDRTVYRGLIRHSKDAQRMHNFWMTAATERVALAPKAPYTGPAEAFEGYENEWAAANSSNKAYLRYNAVPSGDRPKREQPPTMPVAEVQLALAGTDEMKETMGLYDASLGAQGNETSGKAIIARQRQGDRGTFSYVDNLSRAIGRVGQILVEWIPSIYDGERVVRLRFEDGATDAVRINQTITDEQTGKEVLVHDISAVKFDVVVKVGPSYQTQRMEALDSLMMFIQAVPEAGRVVMDKIAANMDWPGADEIAKRLKKILPPGILSPEEAEKEGIQPPPPSPEQQVAMAQAEADGKRAEADVAMAEAKKAEAQARLVEAQAKVREATMMADPGTLEDTVRRIVADALAELVAPAA